MISFLSTLPAPNVFLAIMGIIVHALTIVLLRKEKDDKFSLSTYFCSVNNYLRIGLALFSTFALLIMVPEIDQIINISGIKSDKFPLIISFCCGLLNHYLVRKIVAWVKK